MDKKLQKKLYRKEIRQRLISLPQEYHEKASRKIFENLCNMEVFRKANTIFCFVSMPEEIDTRAVIEYAWGSGKTVAAPKCMEKGQMAACVITKESDLEDGIFGLQEPKASCRVLTPEQIDLIILPCLSCDKKGNRLGYGGGYYDRYLEKYKGVRVLICREKMMLSEIPAESFDQKPHFLVTEKGVYAIEDREMWD